MRFCNKLIELMHRGALHYALKTLIQGKTAGGEASGSDGCGFFRSYIQRGIICGVDALINSCGLLAVAYLVKVCKLLA